MLTFDEQVELLAREGYTVVWSRINKCYTIWQPPDKPTNPNLSKVTGFQDLLSAWEHLVRTVLGN